VKHDSGQLRAYIDGELNGVEAQRVELHLAACPKCRAQLVTLRSRADDAAQRIAALDPTAPAPTTRSALARFHAALAAEPRRARNTGPTLVEMLSRSSDMIKGNLFNPRWRPWTVAATALLIVAILFSFAPVRHAAADFLGLFRVRKFAVIPLDTLQAQKLEDLAKQARSIAGEPTVVREPGQPQMVASAAEASAAADFTVRVPAGVPDGLALQGLKVQTGPAVHYEADRATLQAVLQAAGMSDTVLPKADKFAVDVDIPSMATQQLGMGTQRVEFVQMRSPEVSLPEGIDPIALGKLAFQYLGMSADDAERLATSIDWTSTLVIPLPTDAAQSREVSVDGVTGLLFESTRSSRGESLLMWERDGILYGLSGKNVQPQVLLDIADSLQ
jgi:hypothetical protein